MAIIYKTVFECYNDKYKLAGVATTRNEMGKIAASVSSKGAEHTAVCIDYSCNTPLNDEFFVVYTRDLNDADNDVNTFYDMVLIEGESVPSDKDLFLYKIEKSATDRVDKLNAVIDEKGDKTKRAVMVKINFNTIYNVAKPKVDEPEVKEEVVEEVPLEEVTE